MRLRISFLLCLICIKSYGKIDMNQSTVKTDSIKIWLNTVKNDKTLSFSQKSQLLNKALKLTVSARQNKLYKISSAALTIEDSLLFRTYNKKVIELASKLNQGKSHAFAHWDLADFFEKTAPDSAFYHYQEAYGVFNVTQLDSTNNHYPGMLLIAIGNLQDKIKDHIGAEKNHIEALRYFERVGRLDKFYNAYNGLAIAQKGMGKYDKAIEYYKKARTNIINMKASNRGRAYLANDNNIASTYLRKKDYQKAHALFNDLLSKDSLLEKYPSLYTKVLGSWAISGLKSGSKTFDEYEAALKKSNQMLDSIGDTYTKARNFEFLGEVLAAKGDTINAIRASIQGKSIAENSLNNDRLLSILKQLIVIDKQNSGQYALSHIELNNTLHQNERAIQDKFARIRMETDEIIGENRTLAKQREIFMGIGLILLIGGIGLFTIVSQRIRNQKLLFNQKQQESNQEIYNLMLSQQGKMEEGKKSEKKRISEELHDGILGQMLGIRLILSGLNERTDVTAIEQRAELIQKLQELEEEIRMISHELNASAYQKVHNFMLSIQQLLDTLDNSTNIDMTLTFQENFFWDGLDGDLKINIYRIIQECLQNCIKHSNCKNIGVSFELTKKMLNLKIVDDGVGFDVNKGKKGIGLKNIISRVKKIRGSLNINSLPNKGTTISIVFPSKTISVKHPNTGPERKTVIEV